VIENNGGAHGGSVVDDAGAGIGDFAFRRVDIGVGQQKSARRSVMRLIRALGLLGVYERATEEKQREDTEKRAAI
jgi:hypothetical protein